MDGIVLAFVTGLTTGGLSCLAVQGGLLASSIAHEIEQTVAAGPIVASRAPAPAQQAKKGKGKHRKAKQAGIQPHSSAQAAPAAQTNIRPPISAARPIVLFLAAKIVAYTVLGFVLGLVGSLFQLTPTMRAVLLIAIGVFMVGNALRMLNVHPIFRYFALEPPSFITRYIRRRAKDQSSAVTPLFLGALTVFIPCGVTQAMMAVAMATGDPVMGAAIMFAFTLGTSPVFFTVAYMATRLGSRLEKGFMTFVAIVVLVLGLISIDSGLTLAGWPYSVTNLRMAMAEHSAGPEPASVENGPAASQPPDTPRLHPVDGEVAQPASPPSQDDAADALADAEPTASPLSGAFGPVQSGDGVVAIRVENDGYYPQVSRAKAGQPLKLALITDQTYSCARAFVLQSLGIEKMLPESGTVTIDLPPQEPGTRLFYSCSMGMYSGVILFEG